MRAVAELPLDLDAFEGPFDLLLTLVLKEELRIRRVAMNEIVEKTIPLHRQVARVERLSAAAPQAGPDPQGRRDDGTGDPA